MNIEKTKKVKLLFVFIIVMVIISIYLLNNQSLNFQNTKQDLENNTVTAFKSFQYLYDEK